MFPDSRAAKRGSGRNLRQLWKQLELYRLQRVRSDCSHEREDGDNPEVDISVWVLRFRLKEFSDLVLIGFRKPCLRRWSNISRRPMNPVTMRSWANEMLVTSTSLQVIRSRLGMELIGSSGRVDELGQSFGAGYRPLFDWDIEMESMPELRHQIVWVTKTIQID